MKQQRTSWLVAAVVAFAVVVVALLVLLSQLGGRETVSGEAEAQGLFADIPQNGPVLGRPEATVTIHLYEDFQCPACAQFVRETFPELVERHVKPGEVRVVSETLAFLGPDSVPAAKAALAAGEQDRYWQYARLLFLNQGEENSGYATDEFLTNLAEKTRGLDVGRWEAARASDSLEAELETAQENARDDEVSGTPTLVVIGPGGTEKVVGAVPLEQVEAAIEKVKTR